MSVRVFWLVLLLFLSVGGIGAQESQDATAVLVLSKLAPSGSLKLAYESNGAGEQVTLVRVADDSERVLTEGSHGSLKGYPTLGGRTRYEVRTGEKVLVAREIDLTKGRRLIFAGGSKEQGLFSVIGVDGDSHPVICRIGSPIRSEVLDENGDLVTFESGAILEGVELAPVLALQRQPEALLDARGQPARGLWGNELSVETSRLVEGEALQFYATLRYQGKSFRLAENESLKLE